VFERVSSYVIDFGHAQVTEGFVETCFVVLSLHWHFGALGTQKKKKEKKKLSNGMR
jgi:hypothetical protein